MIKIILGFAKYRIISIIQEMALQYQTDMANFKYRQREWEGKKYIDPKIAEDRFEADKQRQIKYSYDKWLESHHKYSLCVELIDLINKPRTRE